MSSEVLYGARVWLVYRMLRCAAVGGGWVWGMCGSVVESRGLNFDTERPDFDWDPGGDISLAPGA